MNAKSLSLLCQEHNGEKSGKWPSEYYSDEELKKLSILTGIPYTTLAGSPHYNPEAIARLRDSEHVDRLLSKYASYMPEIIRLRNRILGHEGVDFFEYSTTISPAWVRKADREYQRVIRQEDETNTEPNTDEK